MFTVFRWTTAAVDLLFTVHTIVSPVRASSNRRFLFIGEILGLRVEGGRGSGEGVGGRRGRGVGGRVSSHSRKNLPQIPTTRPESIE
jgi:hypothetical protein